MLNSLAGAEEKYDNEACATYCFDSQKRKLVTYDTAGMAREKAEWIKKHNLGGGMWWESSGDKQGEESLVGNVVKGLGVLSCEKNCIEYPHSKFENMNKGFQA